jgi:hypothetical protein
VLNDRAVGDGKVSPVGVGQILEKRRQCAQALSDLLERHIDPVVIVPDDRIGGARSAARITTPMAKLLLLRCARKCRRDPMNTLR